MSWQKAVEQLEAEYPSCKGYPDCDGDLPGEGHVPDCPAFGKPEPHWAKIAVTERAAFLLLEAKTSALLKALEDIPNLRMRELTQASTIARDALKAYKETS